MGVMKRGRTLAAGLVVGALIGTGVAAVTPAGAAVKSAAAGIDWKQVWRTEIKPRAKKTFYTKRQSNQTYVKKTDLPSALAPYVTSASLAAQLGGYYTKPQVDAALGNYYTKTQSDANYYTKAQSDTNYYTKAEADARYRLSSQSLSVASNERFSVMYPLAGGASVGWMAIRGDASIRDASDPAATVTKIGTGQYCINAPGASEGAVGSLQNQGGGNLGTIRVSMGVGSVCNGTAGTNITVETFRVQ
jgi:hypothetical protein